jgi:hypothetical protein
MKTKSLHDVKIVDSEKGQVQAVFATLNVVDHDGDVTLKGAFDQGAEVRISSYNHASWGPGQLPVGKGTIREVGEQAILDGQFFMDTVAGRDTFTVVKELGQLGEWSYGYDVEDSEPGQKDGKQVNFLKRLKTHEVSPVILGAGIGTSTLLTKALEQGKVLSEDELRAALTDYDFDLLVKCLPALGEGQKLIDHLGHADSLVKEAVDRLASVVTLRADEGKKLSDETKAAAEGLLSQAQRIREVLTIEPQISPEWSAAKAREARARELLARGSTHESEAA